MMWIFLLLYILGLNIPQATGEGNSTQMYYVKLLIEERAIKNITEHLSTFWSDPRIDDLEKTTICRNDSDHTNCTCEPSYKWTDKDCTSLDCCGQNTCNFPESASHRCVSNRSVTMKGIITLEGTKYVDCLAKKGSDEFQNCSATLLKEMKDVYSTLRGFDILIIKEYRVGSIIVEFEMTIASKIHLVELDKKSKKLTKMLNGRLDLETSGVIQLSMPSNPVHYEDAKNLRCTTQEKLGTEPTWQLKRGDDVFDITNGTESEVTLKDLATEIELKNISEVWAGEYTCVYKLQSESLTITHKANAVLDVCLLPNIDISVIPGYPHCKKKGDLVSVTVKCEIKSSNESYNVTWTKSTDIKTELRAISVSGTSEGSNVYAAKTAISCNSPTDIPQLTCKFENRCGQKRNASIDVNIIHAGDKFCPADGDWGPTKAGFTAVIKCKGEVGRRKRKCNNGTSEATWGQEVSGCVNRILNNVLQRAKEVDIGVGSLDGNSAQVFSILEDVTNKSHTINTVANLDASVEVLSTLSEKSRLQPNTTSANAFLQSSSNLLDRSLEQSWKTADNDNMSLAENYLTSVEKLLHKANLTGVGNKKNIEVAEQRCTQGSECNSTVFGVSISLDGSDPGSVKMAGFQELNDYLPNKDDKFKPNSIVVSATTEKKQDSVQVYINFKLLKSRPRDVQIKCVSWDNYTRSWSDYGCEWAGPRSEGQCTCRHLSSFAILMSKYPLEVPWITEITYAGLSVSIISLIVGLVIEITVWSDVVKTNSLYLRHTAHINISLCLLVADCCFLASSKPSHLSQIWCKTFVMLKHFCYLSMFFWMLCLSCTLLHQAVFLFHSVSKKTYLRFSIVLGYVCPLLIVAITFLASRGGAEDWYSSKTCWLVYTGLMKGSIHAFVMPVGIIVFVNIFSMLVVIMKLLDHPKNTETSHDKEKKAAITVVRSVVLLTPVFGVTWIFGFALMLLDLSGGVTAYVVNYAFTLLNAFQGLFILLTTCLGDKLVREALLRRLSHKHQASTSTIDSTVKLDSTSKK